MTAVATKPRAKATKAAATKATSIETLKPQFRTVQSLISQLRDGSTPGSTIETLLRHLDEDLLPDALAPLRYQGPITKTHAHRTYEALFTSLAVIDSLIALADGTLLSPTIREAHALLDAAQTELDSAGELARSLPDHDAAADFIRGREIAINMLREADALMDEREGHRWQRGGDAQDNFFKGYLSDIIEDPTMLDGFTAIMSMTTRNDRMDLSELAQITLAETQGGVVGADGTMFAPEAGRSSSPQTALAPVTKKRSAGEAADDAQGHYLRALSLIEMLATTFETNLVYAARLLARKGDADMQAALDSAESIALTQVSADLSVLLEVLATAADAMQDPDTFALWGIHGIFEMSKRDLDDHIEALERAQ